MAKSVYDWSETGGGAERSRTAPQRNLVTFFLMIKTNQGC